MFMCFSWFDSILLSDLTTFTAFFPTIRYIRNIGWAPRTNLLRTNGRDYLQNAIPNCSYVSFIVRRKRVYFRLNIHQNLREPRSIVKAEWVLDLAVPRHLSKYYVE